MHAGGRTGFDHRDSRGWGLDSRAATIRTGDAPVFDSVMDAFSGPGCDTAWCTDGDCQPPAARADLGLWIAADAATATAPMSSDMGDDSSPPRSTEMTTGNTMSLWEVFTCT